jgi:SdpI/YhfL family protein
MLKDTLSAARPPEEVDGPRHQGNAADAGTAIGFAYAGPVPLSLRLILGLGLVLMGIALLTVAALGWSRRLPRNRWAGVRTVATLRSDAAFAVANQVAAVPLAAAGAVAMAGAFPLLAGAPGALAWVLPAVSLVGMLVLAGIGGVAGDRAAGAVRQPPPAPSSCTGTCAGCALVAGCRDDTARTAESHTS